MTFFLLKIKPNIIKTALKIMTWMIRELFIKLIFFAIGIDKKSIIVIKPLGATKRSGINSIFRIFNWIIRTKRINPIIPKAKGTVSLFNKTSEVIV